MYIYEGLYVWCSTGVVCVHTYYYTYVVISINIHKYICSYTHARIYRYLYLYIYEELYVWCSTGAVCVHIHYCYELTYKHIYEYVYIYL